MYQNPYENPYQNPYAQPPKKKRVWPIVLAVVIPVLLIGGLIAAIVHTFNTEGIGSHTSNSPALPMSDYVAVVYVEGTIVDPYMDGYDHQWTLDEIERVRDDLSNVGLILYIDSPGGGIYETDELYYAIEDYKEATGRPVYAYGGSMMASGGYYAAVTAKEIMVNRNCWTGSIGVTAGTVIDISGFLADHNIKATDVIAGKNKTMGGMFSPLTDEQKEIYQSLVDDAYDQFVEVVADGRGLARTAIVPLADGRVYTARQAVDNDLVDAIGTLDDLKADVIDDLGYEPEFFDLEYSYSPSIYDYFAITYNGPRGNSELASALELMDRFSRAPSYLCKLK